MLKEGLLKSSLEELGFETEKKFNPELMTDDEIAKLRFTWVSDEEERAILKELNRRKQMTTFERRKMNANLKRMSNRNIFANS